MVCVNLKKWTAEIKLYVMRFVMMPSRKRSSNPSHMMSNSCATTAKCAHKLQQSLQPYRHHLLKAMNHWLTSKEQSSPKA
eukprot:6020985-Karenia_brevis.AAC.1